MKTVAKALQSATATLSATSSSPRLDAGVLLAHVLGIRRAALLAESQRTINPAEEAAFAALVVRRAALEPIAYIVGHKEFYGLDFAVDRRVLVPRPETELLVDLALGWCQQQSHRPFHIADIGTGSGCIAVTLAVHLPHAHIWAVDLSPAALDVARSNAMRHGVADRITFLEGDGYAPLPHAVDLIATNPPYMLPGEVDPNVARWEPHLALHGGGTHGFTLPARLLEQAPLYLRPGGALLMEIAAWQGALALQTTPRIFPAAHCTLHQDLASLDRVLMVVT
jgi:release factor glutamine methyltransferase